MFRFPKLNSRFPTDALNRESKPNGKSGDDDPPGSSGSGVDLNALTRREQRVREHKPRDIRVCVNGILHGSQRANASQNELKLNIPASERVEFVEVFSEQRVRLMMLSVPEAPPEGPSVRHQVISLSDGRQLSLDVEFVAEGVEVRVAYTDPTYDEVQRLSNLLVSDDSNHAPTAVQHAQVEARTFDPVIRPHSVFKRAAHFLRRGWPRLAVASIIAISLVGIWIYSDRGQSAMAVLEESERKRLNWQYQPDKIVYWEEETKLQNSTQPVLTKRWANNLNGQHERLILRYNQQKELFWGKWTKGDGTMVLFNGREFGTTVYPSINQIKEKIGSFSELEQQVLSKHLQSMERGTDANLQSELEAIQFLKHINNQSVNTSSNEGDGKKITIFARSEVGFQDSKVAATELRVEYDAENFQRTLYRLQFFLKDGTSRMEEARLLNVRETTLGEYENNELSQILAGGKSVKYLSVAEFAEELKGIYSPN